MPSKALIQAVAVTAELCGRTFSEPAARVFVEDLAAYPEAAVLAETVEGLLDGLEGRDREIVVLALQGHTAPEISGQLDRPLRTVYRVLGRVRKRLEDHPQAEEAP